VWQGRTRKGGVAGRARGAPPEAREVLHLRYFDGLTMSEIASALELPASAASSRHLPALRQLRTLLEERHSGAVEVEDLEELLARS